MHSKGEFIAADAGFEFSLIGAGVGVSVIEALDEIQLGALAGGYVAKEFGLIAPWIVGGLISLAVTIMTLPAMLRWDETELA